jgi:phasin family protein
MSQKPRAGVPVRAASAGKSAPKEAGVVNVDPVTNEPVGTIEPAVETVPVVAVTPEVASADAAPVEVLPVEAPSAEAPAPSLPVSEPVAAASDLAAASAKVLSTTITATADTVAAVTAEVAEAAAAVEPTPSTMTQGIKTMMKTTEDFVAFGQANLEAFVKSGQIWSAGVQELTKQIATSAKASFDESVSTFKAMSTVKSVKEAIDLQSNFAKAALEKAMAESNKLTDASIKLTEQTLAPITARVTVAVETFGKAA